MALDNLTPYDLVEPLSSRKKGTSTILAKLKASLSDECLKKYETFASLYASEVDVVIALGRWEEGALELLAGADIALQQMIQKFTQSRVDYILSYKTDRIPRVRDKGDSL